MTSREAYIALNMIDGVGPIRVRALLDQFGTPEAILSAPRAELMRVEGVGEEVARNITGWRETIKLDEELNLSPYGGRGARLGLLKKAMERKLGEKLPESLELFAVLEKANDGALISHPHTTDTIFFSTASQVTQV